MAAIETPDDASQFLEARRDFQFGPMRRKKKAGGQLSSTASQQLNLSRTPSFRLARNGGTKMGLFACLMRKQAAWNNAKIQVGGLLLLLHTHLSAMGVPIVRPRFVRQ